MTTRTKGDYVDGRQLNDRMLWAFINDCKASGAGETEGDRSEMRHFVDDLNCHYVGWDYDNTIWTFAQSRRFTTDITDQYKETPMRCIFQEDDKVVPNGFRAGQNGQHAFSTVPVMEKWEEDKTVLTIKYVYTNSSVSAGTDNDRSRYHQSELRLATENEIKATQAPEQPPLALGSVIKPNNGGSAMIVLTPTPDPDGDITVAVINSSDRTYYRLSRGYTVLGQIMPDGDYRPAASTESMQHPAKPQSAWAVGDVIRLKTSNSYLTVGKEYTIEKLSNDPDCIRIRDDDGDLTTRRRSVFEFVREGA